MPTKRCPTCLFNTLCEEETGCPILKHAPVSTLDIKEKLRLFAKINLVEAQREIVTTISAHKSANQ